MIGTKEVMENEKNLKSIIEFYLNGVEKYLAYDTVSDSLHSILLLAELYNNLENTKKWDKIIYLKWNNIQEKSKGNGNSFFARMGFFNGLAEICFIADILNSSTGNYQKLVYKLRTAFINTIPSYAHMLYEHMKEMKCPDYDCINGASGVIRYLLDCPHDQAKDMAKLLVQYLVDVTNRKGEYPAWYIKNYNLPSEEDRILYASGAINFSLSHGVSGILAILIMALQKGICVSGQKSAIEILAHKYILEYKVVENNIPYWPGMLSYEKFKKREIDDLSRRMSWCYGSIGILRSLQLYEQAFPDYRLKREIEDAVIFLSKIPCEEYLFDSPTICHGYAGMLVVLNVINQEVKSDVIQKRVLELVDILNNFFSEKNRFGFQNIDFVSSEEGILKNVTEDLSFLTGSTGVILSMLSVVRGETTFEKHLLIK